VNGEPVSALRQGLNVVGLVMVIAKRVANFADSVSERFLTTVADAPDLGKQIISGDQIARRPGETQQDFYGFWRKVSGAVLICYLSLQWFNKNTIKIETL
jgi:hypothetical protein